MTPRRCLYEFGGDFLGVITKDGQTFYRFSGTPQKADEVGRFHLFEGSIEQEVLVTLADAGLWIDPKDPGGPTGTYRLGRDSEDSPWEVLFPYLGG